jgi:RND family efflux transporter MFP subunit
MRVTKFHWLLTAPRFVMLAAAILFGVAQGYVVGQARGETIDGFTEPFRTVHVATAETGLLEALQVKIGDVVAQGQLLASLDNDLQRAQLAIAQQQAAGRGRLKAAEAERAVNERRYEKLAQLNAKGHASPEETERAKANLEIATAKVLAEQEESRLFELHQERARLALEKRAIRAPIGGIVSETHRQVGEIVSQAAPQIVTIVELDPLIATFLLNRTQLNNLQRQRQIRVHFVDSDQHALGILESIAPLTDAESGTTGVRIRVANPANKLRGGERCRLELP